MADAESANCFLNGVRLFRLAVPGGAYMKKDETSIISLNHHVNAKPTDYGLLSLEVLVM